MRSLALATLISAVFAADPLSCSTNTLSCSSRSTNSCCSPTYGQVVLELQWIPGYGPSDAFTMHGLWPNTCTGGRAPNDGCDDSRQYSDISSLLTESVAADMNTYWPSDQGDNNVFWSHEWQKHGTCVTTLAPSCFSDGTYQQGEEVSMYFGKALELRSTYDLYAAMNNAGFGPVDSASSGYSATDVAQAIRKSFGVSVQLECKKSAIIGARMYFGVQGRDTYVPQNAPSSTGCRGKVYLPYKNTH